MAYPGVHVDDDAERVVEAFCQYELVERRLAEVSVHNTSGRASSWPGEQRRVGGRWS